MKYYRKATSDVWHFHVLCHHLKNILEGVGYSLDSRSTKPSSGEFCNECQSKAKKDKKKYK